MQPCILHTRRRFPLQIDVGRYLHCEKPWVENEARLSVGNKLEYYYQSVEYLLFPIPMVNL